MDKDFDQAITGARFLKPEQKVNEDEWPRQPQEYAPTQKFIDRFKELAGIVNGDIISDAIKYGELVKASEGCVAFINYFPGVTFTIVVREGTTDDGEPIPGMFETVTIWPFVYDKEEALDDGRWSSKALWRIEEYAETSPSEEEREDWL